MNVWEIHPALVHFPIALLLSAIALDVFAWRRPNDLLNRVATGLLIAGVAAGWLAANFGLLAFYTVPAHTHEAHHLMFWHIGSAVSTLVLFTWLAVVRWFHRTEPITRMRRIIGLVAAAVLMTTGALGGHIVYHGGAGVEPELLAESVRESHSHERVASHDEHDGRGRESRQSYYVAPPDRHERADKHDHGEMHERQHKQHTAAEAHEHERSPELDDHGNEEHEHAEKPTTDARDENKHDHLSKSKVDESKPKTSTAPHHHEVPSSKDPPLGPDFERNVQENRQRNMPQSAGHSMKEHGHDDKSDKNKSGTKHQH